MVADDEEEPHHDGDHEGHAFARVVIFGVLDILPKVPIGWKRNEAQRRDMFFEVKKPASLIKMRSLEGNPDGDAILRIDKRAREEGEHVEEADGRCTSGGGHCTKTRYDPNGRLTDGQRYGHCLMGDRAEETQCQDEVNEQP
ncbi:MAG: hypothetical protein WB495_24525 [Xanthobacteraceae bacterium]